MTRLPCKRNILSFIIFSASLSVGLGACNSGSNYDFEHSPPPVAASPSAAFSPAEGGPTTNNLLINPFTGKLNLPNPVDPDTGERNSVRSALNTLDGFSTVAPITTSFGMPLDPTSLKIGSGIRVFKVSKLASGAITGVIGELGATDITAVATGEENKTLALLPLKPLTPKTTYMVVLTTGEKGIKDSTGTPITASGQYLLLRGSTDLTTLPASTFPATETQTAIERLTQATQIQALIGSMEDTAVAAGIDKSTIALTWSFSTQTITDVLQNLAKTSKAGTIVAAPLNKTTQDINENFLGLSDVYIGTLEVPYYLTPPSQQNPLAALTEYWPETLPTSPNSLTIPFIMTLPNAASGHAKAPATGWPIAIYQHGISRARTDDLIHADAMAQAGYATIAIDLPLHGITDSSNPLNAANTPFPNDIELTFNMDLVDNETNAPGPDGIIDSSGTHFLNLKSLLTSRDNIRQGVSNLLTLRRSLGNIPGVKIDTSKVGFIAHSLGGFIGVPYLAVEDKVTPTSLISTGGGIAQLVNGSVTRGPVLRAGLASAGLTTEAQQAQYLGAAQTILDAADPINFATLAASKHPIHMIEVIGDGTKQNPPDWTVPNLVPPLSGTEPLAAMMGLQSISHTTANVNGIVRFTQGQHETLLTPKRGKDEDPDNADLLDVFIEMHTQITSFIASEGKLIKITDSSNIQ